MVLPSLTAFLLISEISLANPDYRGALGAGEIGEIGKINSSFSIAAFCLLPFPNH
jgi:hypothetical protein